jgi:NADH-quinone oxidoreductase subunit D
MEKIGETLGYHRFIPYTDRLDYLSPLSNNCAIALAAERVCGIEAPPRAQAIRVVCCELARISSHLLGLGAYAMDLGAMTVFLYTFTERETLYNFFEFLTGARFTTSYTRIGGRWTPGRSSSPATASGGSATRASGSSRATRRSPSD